MGTVCPRLLNNGFCSKFRENYRIQQANEDARSVERLKPFDYKSVRII